MEISQRVAYDPLVMRNWLVVYPKLKDHNCSEPPQWKMGKWNEDVEHSPATGITECWNQLHFIYSLHNFVEKNIWLSLTSLQYPSGQKPFYGTILKDFSFFFSKKILIAPNKNLNFASLVLSPLSSYFPSIPPCLLVCMCVCLGQKF